MKSKGSLLFFSGLIFFLLSLLIRFHFAVGLLDVGFFTKYPLFAKQLLSQTLEERVLDFSPNYLLSWLISHLLFPSNWRISALFIHSLIGGLNTTLLFLIAYRLSGKKGALFAGILGTFSLSLITYDISFEPAVLVSFFNLSFLYSFLQAQKGLHKRWALMGTGLFGALSYSTRPNFIVFLLFLLIFLLFKGIKNNIGRTSKKRKKWILNLGIIAAGFIIGIAPALLLNLTYAKKWRVSYMSPGQVFHQGNSPFATGLEPGYIPLIKVMEEPQIPDHAHILYREIASSIEGREMDFEESELFWIKEALKYIKKYPREIVSLWGRKIFYFFNSYDSYDIHIIRTKATRLGVYPLIPTVVIFFFGWIGIIYSLSKRKSNTSVLYILLLAYLISSVVFFAGTRQRMPVIPVYILFATFPLSPLRLPIQRNERKVIITSILIATTILLLITRMDSTILIRERHVRGKTEYLRSRASFSRGDVEEGFEQLSSAVYYNPKDSSEYLANSPKSGSVYQVAIRKAKAESQRKSTLLNRIILGCLLAEAKYYSEALEVFEEIRLRESSYYMHLPYYNIFYQEGKILIKTQRWNDAIRILKEGTEKSTPILHKIQLNYMLSVALKGAGKEEEAKFLLEKTQQLASSFLSFQEQWDWFYAYISAECGFLQDAAYGYNRILRKWPQFHSARVSYANLLVSIGDIEEAYKEFIYLAENSKRFKKYAEKKLRELHPKLRKKGQQG
ncbi:MAG TPA: hypothetical protein EYP78_05055 [Candidatus Omnitrophica bacterium]|nr:hypothetical protein [Candidatus Omnitrophota bacterium]